MTYEELIAQGYENLTQVGLRLRNRKFSKKDIPSTIPLEGGIRTSKGILYPRNIIEQIEKYFSEPSKKELKAMGLINFSELGRCIGKQNLDIRAVPKRLIDCGIKTRVGFYYNKKQVENLKKYILGLSKTEKYTKTVNEKYGVDNVSQLDEIKEKKAETMISNYGTSKSFELQSTKNTVRERYGVDNISQLDEVKAKKAETCRKHYGVEAGFLTEKAKKTIRERYGVDNVSQVPEIQKRKMENTCKKYAFDNCIFDSTWEMAYYFYLKQNKIKFEYHPDEYLEYYFEGKLHRYFPDFKINEKYIEIKGDYLYDLMLIESTVENAKLNCLKENNVSILLEKDIIPYIENFEKYNGSCSNYKKEKVA